MNTDTLIAQVSEVKKSYGAVRALDGVDFSISRGEVRALLGKNGAGKSTLIRMLAGVESPDSGTITIQGRLMSRASVQDSTALGVRTVYQELSLIQQMSVAENLFMGEWPQKAGILKNAEIMSRASEILKDFGLDFSPTVKVADLSIAEQQLVEIARAVNSNPTLLILDEPTSSLGTEEVDRVLETVNKIGRRGVAVIYVSHRLAEIRKIADTVTVMRDGQVIETIPVADATTQEIARAMLGKSSEESNFDLAPNPNGGVAVSVRHANIGDKLSDVSLDVRFGEVLGIAGLLGAGRTELLEAIAGLRRVDAGSIEISGEVAHNKGRKFTRKLGVGFTSEDRKTDGIIPERGIDENLVMAAWRKVSNLGVVSNSRLLDTAKNLVKMLSIRAGSTTTPIKNLSGGNQQKVVIGRQLHAGSHILLLDEPTRGVDIEAKGQIYDLLRTRASEGDAVVFVSSEIEELPLVADRTVVFAGGRLVETLEAPDFDTEKLLVAAMAGTDSEGK
jgi:ABC-type sugar transport system ATPase subunit